MSELERAVNTLDVRDSDELREFLAMLFGVHEEQVEVALSISGLQDGLQQYRHTAWDLSIKKVERVQT
jgi:hypothetical protein